MMTSELLAPDHLQRAVCVYVRQSSQFQVRNNLKSQRLQYGLADYARVAGPRLSSVTKRTCHSPGACPEAMSYRPRSARRSRERCWCLRM